MANTCLKRFIVSWGIESGGFSILMPERDVFSRVSCVPEHTSQTLSHGAIMSLPVLSDQRGGSTAEK